MWEIVLVAGLICLAGLLFWSMSPWGERYAEKQQFRREPIPGLDKQFERLKRNGWLAHHLEAIEPVVTRQPTEGWQWFIVSNADKTALEPHLVRVATNERVPEFPADEGVIREYVHTLPRSVRFDLVCLSGPPYLGFTRQLIAFGMTGVLYTHREVKRDHLPDEWFTLEDLPALFQRSNN